MSSHREAPEISKDPVADNTDVYAFVSPDKPDTVTIITNYIPLQGPAGGPNFFEFGDDVLYSIYIDNDGDAKPDVGLRVPVRDEAAKPQHVSVQHRADRGRWTIPIGTVASSTRSSARMRQRHQGDRDRASASPPCNIGPRSTPNYQALAQAAVHHLPSGVTVFAGQRNDGFFVDLGSIFDLGDLRPFQNLHLIPTRAAPGVDALEDVQRAHDRDPGADQAADTRRLAPTDPSERQGGARHLGRRQPAAGRA